MGKIKIVYYSGWLLFRLLGLVYGMKYRGAENVPQSGPFILAANHQHGLDPFFLGAWNPRQVYFFAKKELWNNRLAGWFFSRMNAFPVKRGAMDLTALRQTIKVLAQGHGLVFFPEGTRGPGDRFLKPKPGIGMIIKHSDLLLPIVPVYLHGTKRLWDCFLRKECLALTIGQLIPAKEVALYLTDRAGYQALAEKVMAEISKLRDQTMSQLYQSHHA